MTRTIRSIIFIIIWIVSGIVGGIRLWTRTVGDLTVGVSPLIILFSMCGPILLVADTIDNYENIVLVKGQ